MRRYIGGTRYKVGQALNSAGAFISHHPRFLYFILIVSVIGISPLVYKGVSVLPLFNGEDILTVKEVIIQEDKNVPPPILLKTSTFSIIQPYDNADVFPFPASPF